MKVLITGGCGNIGTHLIDVFSKKGYELTVIDKDEEKLNKLKKPGVKVMAGDIADKEFVFEAVKGNDAVIHLAWSFAKDPIELFDVDVKGYTHILNAALEYDVEHVINASTAVAYGKPQYSPVDEEHPRIVEKARKPTYALAKLATEKLGDIYAYEHDMAVNNAMIWYAYGYEMGGKHLRRMIKSAIEENKIEIPKDCGGSFLQLDDFADGLEKIIKKKPKGEMFNFATIYLTWGELAEIIVQKANPDAKVVEIPKDKWTGSTFLTDDWKFSTKKAEEMLGYKTRFTREKALEHLGKALEACVKEVRSES